MPVHNGERYLAETLDSIVAQSHRPVEIVVVDDGSSDGTPAVLAAYGHPIVVVRQENAGTVVARNAGLARARGEYIGFLDADDLWHPDKLALQLGAFAARPGLQVSFTFIQNFWSEDVPETARGADPTQGRPVPGYVCPTMLARREAFDRVGPFDSSVRHTSEMRWILAAAELGVAMDVLGTVTVRRRLHAGNQSIRRGGRVLDEYLHLLKASLDRRRQGKGFAHDFHACTRPGGTAGAS
jgi:glycosyltransferase involved in cell wall biosynthesis